MTTLRLSVRHKSGSSTKTAKPRMTQTTRYYSPGTLSFLTLKIRRKSIESPVQWNCECCSSFGIGADMIVVTDPPNGPVLFCSLASVVCRCRLSGSVTLPAGRPRRAGPGGRPAGSVGGRRARRVGGRAADTDGGPVRLRPISAITCLD